MRLGGRLSAAIGILADIETRRRPVADALKDWGLSHRFAGVGDRSAIGNIVYDALRRKRSNAYLMDDDGPRAAALAVMLRQWHLAPDALAEGLAGDRFAPEPLTTAERERFLTRDLSQALDAVRADVPDWILPALVEAFGPDEWLAEADALALRPTLDLRVNTLKADRARVERSLEGVGARPTAIAPHGLRIPAGDGPARLPNVTAEPAFEKGWYEVQDEGSQIVAALVGAADGEQILDYCAGGGGKTLAMAAAMGNRGQIHAYDADRRRLAPMVERLKRAGTRNVQLHEKPAALAGLAGRCDRVLVDAPCTGTGTWRRRPDTKWRLSEKSLAERMGDQDAALAAAAAFVRPGGLLCYVTCSLLPQENHERVAAFLAAHADFEVCDMMADWVSRFGAEAARPRVTPHAGLLLSPHRTGTDGFFFAALRRAG